MATGTLSLDGGRSEGDQGCTTMSGGLPPEATEPVTQIGIPDCESRRRGADIGATGTRCPLAPGPGGAPGPVGASGPGGAPGPGEHQVQGEHRVQGLPLLRRKRGDAQSGHGGRRPGAEFRPSLSLTFGLAMLASENKSQSRRVAIPRGRPHHS